MMTSRSLSKKTFVSRLEAFSKLFAFTDLHIHLVRLEKCFIVSSIGLALCCTSQHQHQKRLDDDPYSSPNRSGMSAVQPNLPSIYYIVYDATVWRYAAFGGKAKVGMPMDMASDLRRCMSSISMMG
jgi:hypothetical protein